MKLPRVKCPECEREVAARPVSGTLSKGHVWRHDAPDMRAKHPDELVSCGGSLEIVDLPVGQMELPVDEPEEAAPAGASDDGAPTLF
ncbi:hypothetical protein ACFYXM_07755 [Streptomyces sp. NPDC002476]|uniref:hypothetical protein n=1 Tax=Streptomyces sp. NPDC002476 TaxID=3364648 RepID=UPI00369BFEBE